MVNYTDNFNTLKQIFVQMMSLNSVMNEDMAELYFYAYMGAKMKGVTIYDGVSEMDLRTSLTIIQTSRTGKSRMNKVLKEVCDNTGVSCVMVHDYTGAGLIGSIDTEALIHNTKYAPLGLSEENPVISIKRKNGTFKEIEWQNPVIIGDLGNYAIVLFDELKILLSPKRENKEILLTIQPALDYPPKIRKKLRHRIPIEYNNPVTIIGTTFPYQNIDRMISTQGYLQRTFVYYRKLNMDEIRAMRDERLKLLNQDVKGKFNALLDKFVKLLNNVDFSPRKLILTEQAKKELKNVNDAFLERVNILKGVDREVALLFSNTAEETALKIAAQLCALYNKNRIEGIMVRTSFRHIRKFMHTVFTELNVGEDKEHKKELNQYINIYKRMIKRLDKDYLLFTEFRDALNAYINRGKNTCGKIIHKLVEDGYFIREKGEKNTHLYKLNEG